MTRELETGRAQGNIYIEDGRITNALCDKDRGEEAFYTLMRWRQARFTLRYGVVAKYKEISLPWESLLIEVLSRESEPHRDTPETVPLTTPTAPAAPEASAATALPSLLLTSFRARTIRA